MPNRMKSATYVVLGAALGSALTLAIMKALEPQLAVVTSPSVAVSPQTEIAAQAIPQTQSSQQPELPLEDSPTRAASSGNESRDQPLPPEFDQIFTQERARNLQIHFLRQPRDAEVAGRLEDQWRQYFSGNPRTSQYGLPEIYCRADVCEVRLLTTQTVGLAEVPSILSGPSQSAYPSPLGVPGGGDVRKENGVTAIVFYYYRVAAPR
jgi:hypothetical protein